MRARLQELVLALETDSSRIRDEWRQHFSSFLLRPNPAGAEGEPDIVLQFALVPHLPPLPAAEPAYHQPDLSVYPLGEAILIDLAHLGQLRVEPAERRVTGWIAPAALDVYGAYEDINAIALAPLLRRRRLALIHAFAAAWEGRGVLLVGENASGKTTSGLALLAAGWRLLANDVALLGEAAGQVQAYAFPGQLSAHPDSLWRVPALRHLADDPARSPRPGWKMALNPEELFPQVWLEQAPVRAICLLSLARGAREHRVERLTPALALGRLLPHSIDRWDEPWLAWQMDLLLAVARQAPVYALNLGSNVPALPDLLQKLVQ